MANWSDYGLAFRFSRANTLHKIDHVELERELRAKKSKCEVRDCNGQAITILKEGVCGLVCENHLELCSDPRMLKIIAKSIIEVKLDWLNGKKQEYFDRINGLQSITVRKIEGVPIMNTARDANSGVAELVHELKVEDDHILPFIF
jgi:hypothetical protein